ncbi:filensin-like [Scleropages formosus]|uniref:Filensin n=1 Tax=Scleropages formosus TaxID=113540 RepID=A0A0P7TRX0_SCLFO|nr:filensin-like [Scleropages formosus]
MYKATYLREVRKEKYEHTDSLEEMELPDILSIESALQGRESMQELNERFARYIGRARVLEQRNAVLRKQLETLLRMEEAADLADVFSEQLNLHRRRIGELGSDRGRLERELKDAERTLDEFNSRYKSECEYQQQLRSTLEHLNKEADNALLRNLEFQIQSQFLQDDINATKERYRKNLAEIQTYVNILRQIDQAIPRLPSVSLGIAEEKFLAQRRVPALRNQLEEYKSTICGLQGEKQKLQSETAVLEAAIRNTQESYDDEIQLYNEQIEVLRRETEEAERVLEKYTSKCRSLAMYQLSLENELERYKRIIENEDNRLNVAIIGTPMSLFTAGYQYSHTPLISSRGKDITQAVQDITSAKPRQKILAKKVLKKKEIASKGALESGLEGTQEGDQEEEQGRMMEEDRQLVPEDVPDGSRISKGFEMLRDLVKGHIRKHPKPQPEPEPVVDIYTKGRYVTVTGEGSYLSPSFCSSSPSAGHVSVIPENGSAPADDGKDTPVSGPDTPPSPGPSPMPLAPTPRADGEGEGGHGNGESKEGEGGKDKKGGEHEKSDDTGGKEEPQPQSRDSESDPTRPSRPRYIGKMVLPPIPYAGSDLPPDSVSYEKVEVVESVEKRSDDSRVKGYEETAVIVETMVEKSRKKKHGGMSS